MIFHKHKWLTVMSREIYGVDIKGKRTKYPIIIVSKKVCEKCGKSIKTTNITTKKFLEDF